MVFLPSISVHPICYCSFCSSSFFFQPWLSASLTVVVVVMVIRVLSGVFVVFRRTQIQNKNIAVNQVKLDLVSLRVLNVECVCETD